MNRQKHTTTSALLLIAMLALVTGCPNDGGNGGKTNADAALSSLTVTAGTETLALSPAFNPDTTAYTLQVPNSINAIKVAAVARNSKATVDKASQDIALVVGANTISVTATAQNGTAKTYTIAVTRLIGETITMKDNASVVNNIGYWSGGVYVSDGAFTMQGNASISGNTTQGWDGGGVYNHYEFYIEGGTITDNIAANNGGGIYNRGRVTVMNATVQAGIHDNTTSSNAPATGPQVYSESGSGSSFEDGNGYPIVPDTY